MTEQILSIGPWQLALTLVFVLTAQVTSLLYGLGLGKDLSIGTIRTFAQLLLMGYALKYVFQVEFFWLTMLVFLIMLATAVHIIHGRIRERTVPFAVPMFLSMLVSYFLVSIVVTGVILGARPWWEPRYFLPLAGMIVGNSMTALSISLERLFSDLRAKRELVEMQLCLGADYREASQEILKDSIRAGMIPSINAMMGVGLVFIPGMMTGQILAGADPLLAIRYQIVVMLMLTASTALGSLFLVVLVRKRCFGRSQQLLLSSK